eukprot:14184631-Ditylum_brightwellii.AAC.1
MVAEGIQQATKSPPTSIINKHCQKTANLAEENIAMQKKLDGMHDLVRQMQQQMAQQQQQPSPYTQQNYQLSNHQLYYNQQQYQPFNDRTNTYNSRGRNYYNNNYQNRDIKMKPHSKTEWEEVREDANDS